MSIIAGSKQDKVTIKIRKKVMGKIRKEKKRTPQREQKKHYFGYILCNFFETERV